MQIACFETYACTVLCQIHLYLNCRAGDWLSSEGLWTGGVRQGSRWIWEESGDEITFDHWEDGEPNNSGRCIRMKSSFSWDDNGCSGYRYWSICEFFL